MAQWNPALTPDEALNMLMQGNANFADNRTVRAQLGMCERRKKELLSGQNPLAIILCCSDSRIAPQYVFDREIGELFVIRVAGNVTDGVVIGSIEYALEQFGTPLVMVLGHQNCGAIQAAPTHALHGYPDATGSAHMAGILEKIAPSVERARGKGGNGARLCDDAAIENALSSAAELRQRSDIVKQRVAKGELKVVSGIFNLLTLKVELVPNATEPSHQSKPACARE